MTASDRTLTIRGIVGSLRERSFNRALLHAARELAPAGMEIEEFDRLGEIPPYDGDAARVGDPEPVRALKRAIGEADGLLFVTPEYNYGVPGVLKNAIDWASRPPTESPLIDKPAGIMGASPGMGGTIRAQLQLRQAFVFTRTHAMLQPEVLVAGVRDKFDEERRLTDEATRKFVARFLVGLAAWTRRIGGSPDRSRAGQ